MRFRGVVVLCVAVIAAGIGSPRAFASGKLGSTPTPTPTPIAGSTVRLTMTGDRMTDCRGRHEVLLGRTYTIVPSAPPGATLSMYRSGATWEPVWSRPASRTSLRASTPGLYRFILAHEERTASLYVAVVRAAMRSIASGGIQLSVPYYRQQHRLSCEAAGLRMAVNYHAPGRVASDMAAQAVIGVDPRPPARPGGCNPNRAFCGNVNGIMMRDGYGVHAAPVARAASALRPCRPAVLLPSGSGVSAYARAIEQGFPVILWGARPGPSGIVRFTWRAWDGSNVVAWSIEHDWVLVGFVGSSSNPSAFIVNNPSGSGSQRIAVASVAAFARAFGGAAVVVR